MPPEIFEPYEIQESEQIYDMGESEKWDWEYFIKQTFRLGENFCEERYQQLRKIGKKITEDTDSNFPKLQEKGRPEVKSIHKDLEVNNPPLILGVGILVLIVLVVIVAVKK